MTRKRRFHRLSFRIQNQAPRSLLPLVCAAALLLLPAGGVRAAVVDSMDTLVGYNSGAGTTEASDQTHAVLIDGQSNQAVQLNFNFLGSSGYAQMAKDFSLLNLGEMYWSGSRLRLYYRGSGPTNTFLFRLTDSDGDQASYRIANPLFNGVWNAVEITRSSFTFSTGTGGDGKFDFFRVKTVETALEKNAGGTGNLDIDRMEVVRDAVAAANVSLDDFNRGPGTLNSFNGSTGTFAGSLANPASTILAVSYDNTAGNVYEGTYSLKLVYNLTATTQTTLGFYTSPNGANLSIYRKIEFYAKSSKSNESFQITFGSTSVQQAVKIGGIGTAWKKVTIDFQNYDTVFRDGVGANPVTEFVVRFVKNLTSDSGTLWIDDVRFVRPEMSAGIPLVVDLLNEPANPELTTWGPFGDVGTTVSRASVEDGLEGRAIRLNYDFKSGAYVGLSRNFAVNAALADGVRFNYKYSGSANNLQFNMLDSDGVRFYSTLKGITSTDGQWRSVSLPFERFQKESTSTLNLRKLKEFRFTVEKDKGGQGFLAVDEFEVTNVAKIAEGDSTSLIQSFSTDNNPFSPNDDGIADTVTFSYVLAEASNIRLRIYDTNGGVLKEFKPDAPDGAGAHAVLWGGADVDGARVKNGLYFVQLKADSVVSDKTDKATSVVAVLR